MKYAPNPRGKLWTEDSNKFGQRMLEKMGWSTGKGLGADEAGMIEPVSVKYKNDKRGFGQNKPCEDLNPHLKDFDSFLSQLNKNTASTSNNGGSSRGLEERARSSKKLFYHRFIKNKDVSQYSAKDMECIFGKTDGAATESEPENTFAEDEIEDNSHGTTTINKGSMGDYFAKMMARKGNQEKRINTEDDADEITSTCDKPSKKMKTKRGSIAQEVETMSCQETNSDWYVNEKTSTNDDERKKKKKQKRKVLEEEQVADVCLEEVGPKSKKKKKHGNEDNNESFAEVQKEENRGDRIKHKSKHLALVNVANVLVKGNSVCDGGENITGVKEEYILNEIEFQEQTTRKHKKKKKKRKDRVEDESTDILEQPQEVLKISKKKKKHKYKDSSEDS